MHRTNRTRPLLILLNLFSSQAQPSQRKSPEHPTDRHHFVRGMTVSCQTWGQEWGTPELDRELDDLVQLGINWISIHPYAWISSEGSVRWRTLDPQKPPPWLSRPILQAHRRGLKVFIKPHLGYWGSPFRWRGEIYFEQQAARARFFESYSAWITQLARATQKADAFAIGTELDRMTSFEDPWRSMVKKLREATPALLTFASNWTDFDKVPFWDALDAIGVQAYFPLSSEENPSEHHLRAGWEKALAKLRQAHQRTGKPVIFTELGYDSSLKAARQPWQGDPFGGDTNPDAKALQARCLRVALETVASNRSWLRGVFLWKWFVGPAPGENFMMDAPHLRPLLQELWSPG